MENLFLASNNITVLKITRFLDASVKSLWQRISFVHKD